MTVFEYFLKKDIDSLVFDEIGNLYLYKEIARSFPSEFLDLLDLSGNFYFISKETYDSICRYNIVLPRSEFEDFPCIRRPYYRLRGMPVTKEQAFEIIRRTDRSLACISPIADCKDYIGCINFDNWLMVEGHSQSGWVNQDGIIGCNSITQTYPTVDEYITEWFIKLMVFPYLDLIIAITYWDEVNPDAWDEIAGDYRDFEMVEYNKEFYQAIIGGIYVSNGTIQILDSVAAVDKYKQYDALYGKGIPTFRQVSREPEKFERLDKEYMKRCIDAYGLDTDAVLKRNKNFI